MKLYSQILGEKEAPALIIMHGVFGMGDNWQTLGRKWAEQYAIHLLDMRNHGRSPHSEAFSYDLMTADLLEYLNEHQLSEAYILGHSMGGKVAMQFAVEHPEKTARLIVADMAPRPYEPHHGFIIEALQSLDFEKLSSRKEAEKALAKKIDNPGIRQFLLKSLYWKEKEQLAWRFNVPVIGKAVAQSGHYLPANAVYSGASLFLRGGKSEYLKDSDWNEIKKHFTNAELATIEGAGHWVHAEKPREFKAAVDAFLAH